MREITYVYVRLSIISKYVLIFVWICQLHRLFPWKFYGLILTGFDFISSPFDSN